MNSRIRFAYIFLLFSYYHLFIQVARTYYRSQYLLDKQYDKAIKMSNEFLFSYRQMSDTTSDDVRF